MDEIHPISDPKLKTKCCGGQCVRPDKYGDFATNKLIGDSCTPLNNADTGESCAGACGLGLFCSTNDERCHARRGVGCACSEDYECLSISCRKFNVTGNNEPRVCAGSELVQGEPCVLSSECASSLCRDSKCAGSPLGQECYPSFGVQCATGLICRVNISSTFYSCRAPCDNGVADCCEYDSDCARSPRGLICKLKTCQRAVYEPVVYPGLDELCQYRCNSENLTCARSCNETSFNGEYCNGARICQLRYQLPDGALCDPYNGGNQCMQGSICDYRFTPFPVSKFFYNCTVKPPTPAPLEKNSVPLNGFCGYGNNYYENCLQSEADMCQYNGTMYVCKKSGTTLIGEFCDSDSTFRNDECVAGSRCVRNGTFNNYLCSPPIQEGAQCDVVAPDALESHQYAQCASGKDNCRYTSLVPCGGINPTCRGYTSGGSPCCACLTPKSIPDGGVCNNTLQCKEATSICYKNHTCVKVEGMDCYTATDCGGETGQFDCNCERKCYLLNNPTPSPTSRAPTVSTAAPSYVPSVPRCDKQQKAWDNVPDAPDLSTGYLSYNSFLEFAPAFLDAPLNTTEQSILIDLICCWTCVGNSKFNSHIYRGYQVDCNSKKLIMLEDTCTDTRNSLAFLNCWAVGSAFSVSTSVGAWLMIVVLMR